MGLPKRRHSKSRRDKRRANQRLKNHFFSSCPQCGRSKLPHRLCPHCGYYRGRPVGKPLEQKKEKKV